MKMIHAICLLSILAIHLSLFLGTSIACYGTFESKTYICHNTYEEAFMAFLNDLTNPNTTPRSTCALQSLGVAFHPEDTGGEQKCDITLVNCHSYIEPCPVDRCPDNPELTEPDTNCGCVKREDLRDKNEDGIPDCEQLPKLEKNLGPCGV